MKKKMKKRLYTDSLRCVEKLKWISSFFVVRMWNTYKLLPLYAYIDSIHDCISAYIDCIILLSHMWTVYLFLSLSISPPSPSLSLSLLSQKSVCSNSSLLYRGGRLFSYVHSCFIFALYFSISIYSIAAANEY